MSPKRLQAMYEQALWYGYVMYKDRKWFTSSIQDKARELGYTLIYYCPA